MGSIEIPETATFTNHGLLIVSNNSIIVGACVEWNEGQQQDSTQVFEFGNVTVGAGETQRGEPGEPFETVPGNVRGQQIQVVRYDLFANMMETAFGTSDIESLAFQKRPFTLREVWSTPEGKYDFTRVYSGCWFTNKGRQHNAEGNRIVRVSGTIAYTKRRKLKTTAA